MQRIHHLRVCANTYTCNRTNHQWEHIMHRQSIAIGEVGIYKNAIHIGVCANTYMCTDTYTCVQLSCICDNKRQLQYHHQRKIGGRLVGLEARLGGGVRTSLLVQYRVDCIAHGDYYLTYPIGNEVLTADLLQRTSTR